MDWMNCEFGQQDSQTSNECTCKVHRSVSAVKSGHLDALQFVIHVLHEF